MVAASNFEKVKRCAEKKAEDQEKVQANALSVYQSMIAERESNRISRNKEHRVNSLAAFRSRKEKYDHEAINGKERDIKDR